MDVPLAIFFTIFLPQDLHSLIVYFYAPVFLQNSFSMEGSLETVPDEKKVS